HRGAGRRRRAHGSGVQDGGVRADPGRAGTVAERRAPGGTHALGGRPTEREGRLRPHKTRKAETTLRPSLSPDRGVRRNYSAAGSSAAPSSAAPSSAPSSAAGSSAASSSAGASSSMPAS